MWSGLGVGEMCKNTSGAADRHHAGAYVVIDSCRSCGSHDLKSFLSLGDIPLVDELATSAEMARQEDRYPLTVAFCAECSLVQLMETVAPEILYGRDYPYYSSFSDSWVDHCRRSAHDLIARRGLTADDLVVELASNDGYMLQWFLEGGIPVLGIDPAQGPAQLAMERGIPTRIDYFTQELGRQLRSEGFNASVVIGNNVLAHVTDQNDLVAGVVELLAPDGVAVFEFPYVADLIERGEFDTIYHEHHCYFSVHAVRELFGRHDLTLVEVEHLDTHGGSLRCYFSASAAIHPSVEKYLALERSSGMTDFAYYQDFGNRVAEIRQDLIDLLRGLSTRGARLGAYGAAAKGATLLNFAPEVAEALNYVVDRNIHKQGRFIPGVGLPILTPDQLLVDQPDYTLLLAWNHAAEILGQQAEYQARGGRFIVPIPTPRVVEPSRQAHEPDLFEISQV